MRAAVAVAAEIDDEGARRHLGLVGAVQEKNVERARDQHARHVEPVRVRHRAHVKGAHARRRRMQHRESVPALADHAGIDGEPGRERRNRRAIRPAQRAGAEDQHGPLGLLQSLKKGMLAIGNVGERLGPGAQVLAGIGERRQLTDEAHRELGRAPALADARVQHRRLAPRISADDKERARLLDAGDGGVEKVRAAAELGIDLRPVLAAVDVRRAKARHQIGEGERLFH
jgi:hypothetical protein